MNVKRQILILQEEKRKILLEVEDIMSSAFTVSNLSKMRYYSALCAISGYTTPSYSSASNRYINFYGTSGLGGDVLNSTGNAFGISSSINSLSAIYKYGTVIAEPYAGSYLSHTAMFKRTSSSNASVFAGSALAYAKYRYSAQRLGITNPSYNQYSINHTSFPAKNVVKTGEFYSPLASNLAAGTYQKFINLDNIYAFAFL